MRILFAAMLVVTLAGATAHAADKKKDDPNQIGNRDIGKCINFYSLEKEIALGKQLAEEVRKAGATPIFLVTPIMAQIKLGFRPESGIASTVMSFNDAKAYPQLYRNETRSDSGHLNNVAAKEFTRIVAEDFLQLRRENRIQ